MLQLLLYSSDIFDEGLITSKFKKNENDLCKIEKKPRFLSPTIPNEFDKNKPAKICEMPYSAFSFSISIYNCT
jgi:hypothetical protein